MIPQTQSDKGYETGILSAGLLASSLHLPKIEIDNLKAKSHLLLPSKNLAHLSLIVGQLRTSSTLKYAQKVH